MIDHTGRNLYLILITIHLHLRSLSEFILIIPNSINEQMGMSNDLISSCEQFTHNYHSFNALTPS
jgi:hypothetical protein